MKIAPNTTLFSITLRAWGNRKKVDSSVVNTNANKAALSVTKKLVTADEYLNIVRCQNDAKRWCMLRSMPSYLRDGVFVVKLKMVEQFEQHLAQSVNKLQEAVMRFLAIYPQAKEEARSLLGDLFNEQDYPEPTELVKHFGIEWNWLTFEVPDVIPKEVQQREVKKLQEEMKKARQAIVQALYEGFEELVVAAKERFHAKGTREEPLRLSPFLANFREFVETFEAKNVFDDAELARLVSMAKQAVGDREADTFAASSRLRKTVVEAFEGIKQELEVLKRTRKITI